MPTPQKQLRCAIPYCHDNLIACEKRIEGLSKYSSEPKITDAYFAIASNHDVRGFEITMHDPIPMKIENSLQKLVHD
jgi:hypothetical protein